MMNKAMTSKGPLTLRPTLSTPLQAPPTRPQLRRLPMLNPPPTLRTLSTLSTLLTPLSPLPTPLPTPRTLPTLSTLLTPLTPLPTRPRLRHLPLLTLILLLTATATHAHAGPSDSPAPPIHSHADRSETPSPASAPDRAAIAQVLNNYTTAVTNGDEALFLTTLLDDQIPFFAAGDVATQPPSLKSADTHTFAAFKRAVFHTNTRYRQTFDHVSIEQDKSLACVRLHFITRVVSSGAAAEGWKTLQLLKVGDQWKIASEFYTVRNQRSNATPDKQNAQTR
jgi:hypothetical protein